MLTAFHPQGSDYWARARQPLNCLAFLAPLLVFYEVGVFWAGGDRSDSIRNGADFWMRSGLSSLGIEFAFLLPVLVVGILLVWQIAGKYPWRITPDVLAGMAAESLLFAVILVLVGQLQDLAFRQTAAVVTSSTSPPLSKGGQGERELQIEKCKSKNANWSTAATSQPNLQFAICNGQFAIPTASISEPYALPRIVGFVGAGVYEEVLFRLCLLPICYGLLRLLLLPAKAATILAVIAVSVVFSYAHFIGPAADPWTLFSFTFRVLAGLFFAVLFVLRGFGVAAGCHAVYDLLVGVLLEMQQS